MVVRCRPDGGVCGQREGVAGVVVGLANGGWLEGKREGWPAGLSLLVLSLSPTKTFKKARMVEKG